MRAGFSFLFLGFNVSNVFIMVVVIDDVSDTIK